MEYCLVLYLTKVSPLEKKMFKTTNKTEESLESRESDPQIQKQKRRLFIANIIERSARIGVPLFITIVTILYILVCAI